MQRKGRVLHIICLIAFLVMIAAVATYAFFTAVFTGVEEDTTITIRSVAGPACNAVSGPQFAHPNNIAPGWSATHTFTISNALDQTVYYNIMFTDVINTFVNVETLVFTLNGTNGGASISQTQIPETDTTVVYNVAIPGNTTQTYTLRIDYLSAGFNQSDDIGAMFNFMIMVDNCTGNITEIPICPEGTLCEEILENNPIRTGGPNFLVVANNENRDQEEGVWQIQDERGTSYIFRGTHQGLNNNVIFAGHQWKILRIEGNANIRMIYNGVCTLNAEGTNCIEGINGNTTAEATTIGNSTFQNPWNHNRFIGYMFGSETGSFNEQHANINNSVVKTFVDNWFNTNITAPYRNMVADDTIFCIDRSLSSGTGLDRIETQYGTRSRTQGDGLPLLVCPREEDRLLLPVGMLNLDEINIAGGRGNQPNNDFFLRTNNTFWTLSPGNYNGINGTVHVLTQGGSLLGLTSGTMNQHGVRPVISLRATVEFSTGNGSLATPFIVN